MNILLINVSLRPGSPIKLFPVGLGYIATAIKNAGFDFDLLDIDAHRFSDQAVDTLIKKKKYDVVAMGCIVTGYKIIKSLAATIREAQPFTKIIVGNSVATSIVSILLNRTKVDIAVMGEGDETIVDLLHAINESRSLNTVKGICFKKDGEIIETPPRPYIKDVSSIPSPDFSIFDIEIYIENSKHYANDPTPIPREEIRALPVNTARGCIARCTFCYHNFKGIPYRHRSADSIVADIKFLLEEYSLNYIHFWDELTFFSKKQTMALIQKILDADLHFFWEANCRADLFDKEEDIEIMHKMKQAGCLAISYSLESADIGILKAMDKHITPEQFSRQTALFHKAGLPTYTSIVLGYPQETPETIKKTFQCCIENRIYPSTGYLLPQPGSPMYEYALKHGHITDEEDYLLRMGDRQDLRLNLTKMTDTQFQNHVIEELKRCNEELKTGLKVDELIKTQYYRSQKDESTGQTD
jgi:anaerobic magnesium-protoporphyrin IX monomethyl ester cyclase